MLCIIRIPTYNLLPLLYGRTAYDLPSELSPRMFTPLPLSDFPSEPGDNVRPLPTSKERKKNEVIDCTLCYVNVCCVVLIKSFSYTTNDKDHVV